MSDTSISYQWTLSRGTIFSKDRVYLLAYSARESGTRVFRWTGKWDNYYLPFISAGICSVRWNSPCVMTLGIDGTIHSAGPNGFLQTHVDLSEEGPTHRGVLRDIKAIGDYVYAIGLGKQIYRCSQSKEGWERFDNDIVEPLGSDSIGGFESIDGFGNDELYAVGMGGEMYTWNRKEKWRQIASPSNLILENVICAPDKNVYVCGQRGLILVGRDHHWEVIEHGLTEDTFWDSVWYQDKLWLSTKSRLYTLESGNLVEINVPGVSEDFRYLSAADGVLWAIGGKQILVQEKGQWMKLPVPE